MQSSARSVRRRDTYEVKSLVRGLRVLETLERSGRAMTLSEMADKLDTDRSTMFRYCATLTETGYLELDPLSKRYSLGVRLRTLGLVAQAQWEWLDLVVRELPPIANEFGGAASFAVLEEVEIVYFARAVAEQALVFNLQVGNRLPAWRTSIGKVLLAEMSDEDVADLLVDVVTEDGLRDLVAELDVIRSEGYALNLGGIAHGLNSVAIAVYGTATASPVGGVNLAGSAASLDVARLRDEVVPALRQLAANMGTVPQR